MASDQAHPQPAVQLPPDSVGYRLLQAAGWRPGAGLGSEEQGIAAPLQAHRNPGTRGVGFSKQGAPVGQPQQLKQQQTQHGDRGGGIAAQVGQKRSALIAGIVDKELAGESMEAKLAHHRAAEAAAADAAHARALQRTLFAAFNDPFDNAGAATANTNPLSWPNRLTATNPLLGSDSD
uniref:G-patch domain-containing protein n=1 Tax=Dunaliella tertiolecta TaxID=3047 RepID=A0A7S3VI92_DUNTE|mmetsp:Transcript_14519/g.39288  ORF Transcript_14519/g.39288 Transcript_14519/m.39288 type:complete len:178 (-) Transcript_14519:450-983(-)